MYLNIIHFSRIRRRRLLSQIDLHSMPSTRLVFSSFVQTVNEPSKYFAKFN